MPTLDPWSGAFLGLLVLVLSGWAFLVWKEPPRARDWWQPVAFFAGLLVAAATVFSPVDSWGEDGLLAAHLGQHIALGDLAAPLLLLGLAPLAKRWLRAHLATLATSPTRAARLLTYALSPVGALVLWALVTYLWFIPAVHLLAVPAGAVHLLDHVSFLCLGLLIWIGAFDPRPRRDVRTALRLGGLPWWGRHIYAMVSRLALLPPAIAVWIASAATYYDLSQPWRFSLPRSEDQELAASVMIGFEMILFSLAIFLAFIFVIVASGRTEPGQEPW